MLLQGLASWDANPQIREGTVSHFERQNTAQPLAYRELLMQKPKGFSQDHEKEAVM